MLVLLTGISFLLTCGPRKGDAHEPKRFWSGAGPKLFRQAAPVLRAVPLGNKGVQATYNIMEKYWHTRKNQVVKKIN